MLWRVLKSDSQKEHFARVIIPTLEDRYFEVFRPMFDSTVAKIAPVPQYLHTIVWNVRDLDALMRDDYEAWACWVRGAYADTAMVNRIKDGSCVN